MPEPEKTCDTCEYNWTDFGDEFGDGRICEINKIPVQNICPHWEIKKSLCTVNKFLIVDYIT